jgi:hypothetical protein
MNFITTFFQSIYRSATNIRWLRDMRGKPNSAWTYFFSFMLFVVLVQMITLMITVPRDTENMWRRTQVRIPEFSATVEEGILHVSDLEQPYIVEGEEGGGRFRFVVDTGSDTAISEDDVFDSTLDAGILITAEHMSFYDAESGQVRTQSFPRDAHWRFNRNDLVTFGDHFVGKILPFLIPLAIFFVFLFWSAGKLVYLLMVSLLVWVAGMFGGKEWKFPEVYAMGLYAITLPTIVHVVLAWAGVRLPFVYTILLFALMLSAVLLDNKKKKTTPKSKPRTKRKTTEKKK